MTHGHDTLEFQNGLALVTRLVVTFNEYEYYLLDIYTKPLSSYLNTPLYTKVKTHHKQSLGEQENLLCNIQHIILKCRSIGLA